MYQLIERIMQADNLSTSEKVALINQIIHKGE